MNSSWRIAKRSLGWCAWWAALPSSPKSVYCSRRSLRCALALAGFDAGSTNARARDRGELEFGSVRDLRARARRRFNRTNPTQARSDADHSQQVATQSHEIMCIDVVDAGVESSLGRFRSRSRSRMAWTSDVTAALRSTSRTSRRSSSRGKSRRSRSSSRRSGVVLVLGAQSCERCEGGTGSASPEA
jgi:hypothetical protein